MLDELSGKTLEDPSSLPPPPRLQTPVPAEVGRIKASRLLQGCGSLVTADTARKSTGPSWRRLRPPLLLLTTAGLVFFERLVALQLLLSLSEQGSRGSCLMKMGQNGCLASIMIGDHWTDRNTWREHVLEHDHVCQN